MIDSVQSWIDEAPEGSIGPDRKHEGRRRLAGHPDDMRGSEDDVVIYIDPRPYPNELVTRARERLVIVTYEKR